MEASYEVELRPKGLFLESFMRRGLESYGVHAFFDSADRYLVGAVATGSRGSVLWTGAVGGAGTDGALRGRTSLEVELAPSRLLAFGARVEDAAGATVAWIPYLNAHFPGTSHTFRLTLEHRQRSGAGATFLELGAIF